MAPMDGSGADAESDAAQQTSDKIREEQAQIGRVQRWWADGRGPGAVSASPILSAFDMTLLSELIEAGGGYHTILSADRLDGLHRRLGSGTDAALEPLRRALGTRGSAKSQARVVGMLLFREARALYEQSESQGTAGPSAAGAGAAVNGQSGVPEAHAAAAALEDASPFKLDESWSSPRRFICSSSYPKGAQMAVRLAPDKESEIITTAPAGTEYIASGRVGDYLQVKVSVNGVPRDAYVPHTLGNQVLLEPAPAPAAPTGQAPGAAPATAPGDGSCGQEAALDEAWWPPRRFVCADTYPAGAQMAVRAAPNRDSRQVRTLPAGAEYVATGCIGEYLQISLDLDDGSRTSAYVLKSIGNLTLLVPEADTTCAPTAAAGTPATAAAAAAAAVAEATRAAAASAVAATDSRVQALEARVAKQDKHIAALQAELALLRSQLAAVATAFRPLDAGAQPLASCGGA